MRFFGTVIVHVLVHSLFKHITALAMYIISSFSSLFTTAMMTVKKSLPFS